jgi:hypothetical protein
MLSVFERLPGNDLFWRPAGKVDVSPYGYLEAMLTAPPQSCPSADALRRFNPQSHEH